MGAFIDLSGRKFGRLSVIEQAANHPTSGRVMWTCSCDCGTVKNITSQQLVKGGTVSCGCAKVERFAALNKKYLNNERTTYKKEWQAWIGMRRRCNDVNSQDYKDYMERGIRVSVLWQDDFLAFLEHIGPAPKDGQRWSVGRTNNNLGYEPNNVEWQLDSKQARNHSLHRNNISGAVGVCLTKSGHGYGHEYYLAFWTDLEGKRKTKCFCTYKYGHEEAFELAVAYRKQQIEILNAAGAGYADSHGNSKQINREEAA